MRKALENKGAFTGRGNPGPCTGAKGRAMFLFGQKARQCQIADQLIGLLDDAIVVADVDHNIVRFNGAAEKMFGYRAADILGQPLDTLMPERFHLQHGLMMDDFAKDAQVTRHMDRRSRQIFALRKGGAEFLASVQIIKMGKGDHLQLAALIRDVGQDAQTEQEVLRLAAVDPLTGAYNRRELMAMGEREALRANRYQHPLSVLLLDLDDFTQLNDSHGTAAGDAALQAFADMCAHALRSVDIMGRWSPREFIILLPETAVEGAMVIAERLRRQAAEIAVPTENAPVRFTVSIGISQYKKNEIAVDAPVARAGQALLDAKRGGRNRVIVGK